MTISVAADASDLAATALLEQLSSGCRVGEEHAGHVALDVWFPVDGSPSVDEVRATLAAWGVQAVVSAEQEDPRWYTAAQQFHRPIEIAGTLRVRPPWEPPSAGLIDVLIDPGMAFGSGQHATTRSCLAALCELPRADLLDIGCGSGILAIAAAKLGYGPVRAVDNDPLSVGATRQNAVANGVSLEVSAVAAGEGRLPGARVVVANLTATTLCELAGLPPEPLPRHAVLSGVREFELDAVHAAWARHGLVPAHVHEQDGWCTSVMSG